VHSWVAMVEENVCALLDCKELLPKPKPPNENIYRQITLLKPAQPITPLARCFSKQHFQALTQTPKGAVHHKKPQIIAPLTGTAGGICCHMDKATQGASREVRVRVQVPLSRRGDPATHEQNGGPSVESYRGRCHHPPNGHTGFDGGCNNNARNRSSGPRRRTFLQLPRCRAVHRPPYAHPRSPAPLPLW
jgi:hypothetical protein